MGHEQLHRYCIHSYDAYQHILILKSCADLQKFPIENAVEIDEKYIKPINLQNAMEQLPKPAFILYLLCKALIEYIYQMYGYNPETKKSFIHLEKIEEGDSDEEDQKTPQFY